jgi:hypothetical protein
MEAQVRDRFVTPFAQTWAASGQVQVGKIMLQASIGKAHVSTAVFVRCLEQAGCHTIRLKEYGQKMPIER